MHRDRTWPEKVAITFAIVDGPVQASSSKLPKDYDKPFFAIFRRAPNARTGPKAFDQFVLAVREGFLGQLQMD